MVENNEEALYKGLKEIINNEEKLKYYKEKSNERVEFFNYRNRIKIIENILN